MSNTVVTSASPIGAGRIIDCSIDFNGGQIGGFGPTFVNAARAAFGGRLVGSQLSYNGTGGITNGGTVQAGVYSGRFCNRYSNGGAGGQYTTPINMAMPIVQPTQNLANDAQINNMRFIFTMAKSGTRAPVFPLDAGISFCPNSTALGRVWTPGGLQSAGFGVFYEQNGNLWWGSRANQLPINSLPADTQLLTTDNGLDWHEVEFRFQCAQVGADATVTVVVDGVEQLTRNWGVGTLLPDSASIGAAVAAFGLQAGCDASAYADSVYFSQIRFVAASSFSSMF